MALQFVASDHAPESFHADAFHGEGSDVEKYARNAEEAHRLREEWEKEHHWHKQHHWDYPMLPVSYTEASCLQCHKETIETIRDAAPTLSRGWRLLEEKGCYACHKIQGFGETRRPGPSLCASPGAG